MSLSPRTLFVPEQADTTRTSGSGGSPPRVIGLGQAGVDEKERSVNSDEGLEAVEEEVLGARRDRKHSGAARCARRVALFLVVLML